MAEKKKTTKKSVKKTAHKSVKKQPSVERDLTPKDEVMEERVEDYLYNPDTDVKIEPPKEEDVFPKPKRRKKKSAKKKTNGKTVSKMPIGTRIALTAAKVLFLWVPVALITIVFLALIAVKAILSPGRVESLAEKNFNALSNSELNLDVKKFNPYGGFVIEDISITNPKGFGDDLLLSIDKVVLDYSFFSLFTGNVRFREIGVYSPKVLLVQKGDDWNVAKLMKPSDKKAEEKSEKKKKPKKDKPEKKVGVAKESIKLPISVSVLFNFILKDLDVRVYGSEFSTVLKGFDTSVNLDIPSFKEIALGPKAVEIIKTLSVKVNPEEKLYLSFNSDIAKVSPPLMFTFALDYKGEANKSTRFESYFKAGTYGTPIQFQGTDLKPLSVNADYDLYYDPVADYLKINSFGVNFASDRWLDLGGTISDVTKSAIIDIAMKESLIDLNKLYPYYLALFKDSKMKFSGQISLKPLEVKGTGKELDVNAAGAIGISNFKFSMPELGFIMPKFVFDYDVSFKDNNVDAVAGIKMPNFRYKLGRHLSGYSTLLLDLQASTAENFKVFNLEDFGFIFKDPKTGLNALTIDMNANASMKSGIMAKANISKLVYRNGALANTLPKPLAETVGGIPLQKPVSMNLSLDYAGTGGGTVHNADVLIGVKVPDYDVYDLKLNTDVEMNMETKLAKLHALKVWSKSYGLNLLVKGFVDTNTKPGVPFANSNIDVNLKIKNNKMRTMYGPWKLKGIIGLNANMKGDLKTGRVKGNIDIDNLYVKNEEKTMLLDVEDLNLDFPYEYKFTSDFKGISKTAQDKTDVITNQYFKENENFTIKSIKAAHPARDLQYEYMKDLKATIFFKDNTFEISKLQTTVMNGSVYMRDTFFYLADMTPENMEYNFRLDATNVNIGKLDNPDKETKTNSEISLTSKITGKGLNLNESLTTDGYVKIYKVGSKFANQLMKGLSGKKGESKLGIAQPVVDEGMVLDKFLFNIEKGNVYTTVKLRQKFVTKWVVFTKFKNNEIKFDRIPVNVLIRDVMKEGEE